jgi:hypothetical protein
VLGGPSVYRGSLQRDLILGRLWNRLLTPGEVNSVWQQLSTAEKSSLPATANLDRSGLISEWLMSATNAIEGGTGGVLIDSLGRNPLQLQGTASLWNGKGPLHLEFPGNGATNVAKSVTLRVSGGAGALNANASGPLQYELQIDEVGTFDSGAFKSSGWQPRNGTWKPILKPATQYFWRARVRDASSSPEVSNFATTNGFITRDAATWYVRPGTYTTAENPITYAPVPQPGVYDLQDGSSYSNAWNGILSAVWGDGGVEPGDTLYVCGLHYWARKTTASYVTAYLTESGYSDDYPINIRMDYGPDPGTFWGVSQDLFDPAATWQGPDANGVYVSTNQTSSADYCLTASNNIVPLDREATPTWAGHTGASFTTNGVWYVKMPDGTSPAGRILTSRWGYRLSLGRSSYIRFYSSRFCNGAPNKDEANWDPGSDTQTALPLSSHVTFEGCDLRYNSEITPTPGNDFWTVRNCELAYSGYGVYTVLNRRLLGADRLTVVSNYIHDMGTPRFPNIDEHRRTWSGSSGRDWTLGSG